MKLFKLTLLPLALLLCFACESEEDVSLSTETMSTEEAAEIVSSSLADNSAGLNKMVSDMARTTESSLSSEMESQPNVCGYEMDTIFSATNPSGTAGTYSYEFTYAYEIQCRNNGIPENLVVESNYQGSYDGPRLLTENAGVASLIISGFPLNEPAYVIEGNYDRSGSFQSRVRNMTESNSTIAFDLIRITYSKQAEEISEGTASLTLSGTLKNGEPYSYTGSLSFEGNGTAILTINGETYTIDIETGEIS